MSAFRVLVIEDDAADQELVQIALGETWADRYEVDCVGTLKRGIEAIEEGWPDVVVLDLGLPDAQGLDGVEKIAAQGIPFIVLTGLEDENMGRRAMAMGAFDYLAKSQVFAEVLERAVRYALLRAASGQKPVSGTVKLDILFIEDDPADLEYYTGIVQSMPGFEVAVEQVHSLEEVSAKHADLVILDLNLPKSRGLETLLEALPMIDPKPVVVLTGEDDMELAKAAISHGAHDYLVKSRMLPEQLRRSLRFAYERKSWLQH